MKRRHGCACWIEAFGAHARGVSEHVPPLVRDLLRPQAWGAASSLPVALRTTHASWVFLVGEDAWKVKRPVDFGFLDFRTLAARRRFCEDEVRLNRRLAPDVYLGVEPVRASPGGLSITAPGPIVDWAVHMRRLPDEASAAAMLAADTLTADHLAALAETLADFHRRVPATPAFGGPEAMGANVDENFAQVQPFVGDVVDAATFDEVRRFHGGALAERRERFTARVEQGRIREGHGDLRLEHVYFLPPPAGVVAIDCIEFNDRFRCGDVAGEAAFLAMELEVARRPDLAAGFVARFVEASDDFGLYGVLDFYLSYRAWVRGKVAAFVAADPAADAPLQARKREEARRDFALARAFVGPPMDPPFLVAVGGVIGSGKSTVAAALGRALAVPVVSTDRTRKAIAGLSPTERGAAGLYSDAAVEATYEQVLRRAGEVLASGRGAILDATFSARRWRTAAAAAADAVGARFVHVETHCADAAVLKERLRRRRTEPSLSDATDAELDMLAARYEPVRASEPGLHLAVDTSGAVEPAVASALRALERAGVLAASARRAS
jgi:aminoglycoside phosphotransferase family enzyme/predicted kinase